MHDIDVIMCMCNLIECSDIYSITSVQEVPANTIEMKQPWAIIAISLVLLMVTILVFRSNLKKK